MKTAPFNINSYVHVKITERGLTHMKKKHDAITDNNPEYPFKAPDVDENGYSRMQMHSVMYWFGEICSNGMQIPIETEILIEHGT